MLVRVERRGPRGLFIHLLFSCSSHQPAFQRASIRLQAQFSFDTRPCSFGVYMLARSFLIETMFYYCRLPRPVCQILVCSLILFWSLAGGKLEPCAVILLAFSLA